MVLTSGSLLLAKGDGAACRALFFFLWPARVVAACLDTRCGGGVAAAVFFVGNVVGCAGWGSGLRCRLCSSSSRFFFA